MTTEENAASYDSDAEKRLNELSELIQARPQDDAPLIERGRLYWALGRRSLAIGDYLAAQKINPGGPAPQLLQATNEILNFYPRDLYNP